jgi:serine/threonine protein kinase
MNERDLQPDRQSLPLEVEQEIDRLCDEFELAWKSGSSPRIEDFLCRLPVAARAIGLRELLAQEIDLRQSGDELADCKEYERRFADDYQAVRDAFALFDERGSAEHHPAHTATTIPLDGVAETSREVSVDPQSYSDFMTLIPAEYAIKEIVGQGGMGLVIRAHHRSLDRDVALKLVRGDCSHERFLREARLLAKIRSPFVVAVNDYQVLANGTPMLVMEWIDGWDLGKVMRQRGGSISEDEARRWMQHVCEGMTAAESHGIIHRDLKPSNIVIDEAGHARVADFGLARTTDLVDEITVAGSVMGTPYYMAPEQAEDPQSVDTRADIYSFGATFYHALTGRPPFDGKTPFAILFNHKTEPLVPPQFRRPDLTTFTSELLERCLAKDPSARFSTFSEIARLLASVPDTSPWTAQDDPALTAYWAKYQTGKGGYLPGAQIN